MLAARILALCLLLSGASANLAQQACWKRNCLARNDAGTICFIPASTVQVPHTCEDEVLAHLLDVHVNSTFGVSIAYYNERASLVGTSSWTFRQTSPSPLFLCMSGQNAYTNGVYRTVCRLALHDDDVLEVKAHARECWIDVGQQVVTDGCYTPMDVSNTSKPPRTSGSSAAGAYSTLQPFVLLCVLAVVLGGCALTVRYRSTRANFLSVAGRMIGRSFKGAILATANVFSRGRPLTSPFLFLLSLAIPGFDAYAHASTAAEPVFGAASELGSVVPDIGIGSSTA